MSERYLIVHSLSYLNQQTHVKKGMVFTKISNKLGLFFIAWRSKKIRFRDHSDKVVFQKPPDAHAYPGNA